MKVVITGATGTVGTTLLGLLAHDPRISEVVGITRQRLRRSEGKVRFETADLCVDSLVRLLSDADAVVHLAWLDQSARDLEALHRVNVEGSERVFRAAAESGVRVIVHASSLAVYPPRATNAPVSEDAPLGAVMTSLYSRQKAEVEARLDAVEREYPWVRVVRLRPAIIFKRDAIAGLLRVFSGGTFASTLLGHERAPFVPDVPGVVLQAVHTVDLAEAFRAALLTKARGAFNVVADPVLDPAVISEALGIRLVRMDETSLRSRIKWAYRLRLQPVAPRWFDLNLQLPLADSARARRELGWEPRFSAAEALRQMVDELRAELGSSPTPVPSPSERVEPRRFEGFTTPSPLSSLSWRASGPATPRPSRDPS